MHQPVEEFTEDMANFTFVPDYLVVRRMKTIKNRIRESKFDRALFVLEDTLEIIEKGIDFDFEPDIKDAVVAHMEMANYLLLLNIPDGALKELDRVQEVIKYETPRTMPTYIMQQRLAKETCADIGILDELPMAAKWQISKMLI
jgi:hypothetical protein